MMNLKDFKNKERHKLTTLIDLKIALEFGKNTGKQIMNKLRVYIGKNLQ